MIATLVNIIECIEMLKHCVVCLELMQQCMSTTLQLKKRKSKKETKTALEAFLGLYSMPAIYKVHTHAKCAYLSVLWCLHLQNGDGKQTSSWVVV